MRKERNIGEVSYVSVLEVGKCVLPYVHDEHNTELVALRHESQIQDAGAAEGLEPVVLLGHVPVVKLCTL